MLTRRSIISAITATLGLRKLATAGSQSQGQEGHLRVIRAYNTLMLRYRVKTLGDKSYRCVKVGICKSPTGHGVWMVLHNTFTGREAVVFTPHDELTWVEAASVRNLLIDRLGALDVLASQ